MAETTTKKTTLVEDLIKVQGEMPTIRKDRDNDFTKSKYATLDAIIETAFPILTKHNLAWVTTPGFAEEGEPVLHYALIHSSGERIEGTMRLMLDKSNSQGLGSALTYARRYAITAVLGLATGDDDDGHTASNDSKGNKVETKAKFTPKPSEDVEHPLSREQVAELMELAKTKGAATKAEAIAFINRATRSADFTALPQDEFSAIRKKVTLTKRNDEEAKEIADQIAALGGEEVPFE